MAVDVLDHFTDFATLARKDILAGNTFDTVWEDATGAYRVDGGGVTSIPITNGGNYSVAPTVSMTANGFTNGRVNGTGTTSLTGTVITVLTITNQGKAMIPTPTVALVGGTGSGGVLGTPVLLGNTLQERFAGTSGGTGSAPWLLRVVGNTGQNQRIVAEFIMSATTDKLGLVLRYNSATSSVYAVNFTGTSIQTWKFKNGYNGAGTGTATQLGGASVSYTQIPVGHRVRVDFQAVSTSVTTTDLTVTVTNLTTSTQLATKTVTADADTDLQAAGRVGVGFTQSTGTSVSTLTTYNGAGVIAASVTSLPAHSTNNVDIVGADTDFENYPPTVSGPAGTILNSVTVVDATHATLNITTGDTSGNLTIQASTPGQTGQYVTISVTGINVPTMSRILPTTSGCTLTFTGTISGGTAPYSMEVIASTLSAQVPGGSPLRSVGTQTGISEAGTPSNRLDSLASSGIIFYTGKITDTNGLVAYTRQTQSVVPIVSTAKKCMFIGDSITVGVGASATLNQRVAFADVTTGGTGYTSEPAWSVNGGTALRPAVVGGSIRVGNVIKAIWFSDPGEGYTVAPTSITATGGGGTGVVIGNITLGGGHVRATELIFRMLYGYSTLRMEDCGQSGTQAANWMPIGTTAGGATNSTFYLLAKAFLQAGNPTDCPLFVYGLAINDSNIFHQVTAANYKLQVKAGVDAIIAAGYKVILKIPTFPDMAVYAGTDAPSILRLQQYIVALQELVADYDISDSGMVALGVGDNFTFFAANLPFEPDGLHPDNNGHWAIAAAGAMQIGWALGLTPAEVTIAGFPRQLQ